MGNNMVEPRHRKTNTAGFFLDEVSKIFKFIELKWGMMASGRRKRGVINPWTWSFSQARWMSFRGLWYNIAPVINNNILSTYKCVKRADLMVRILIPIFKKLERNRPVWCKTKNIHFPNISPLNFLHLFLFFSCHGNSYLFLLSSTNPESSTPLQNSFSQWRKYFDSLTLLLCRGVASWPLPSPAEVPSPSSLPFSFLEQHVLLHVGMMSPKSEAL